MSDAVILVARGYLEKIAEDQLLARLHDPDSVEHRRNSHAVCNLAEAATAQGIRPLQRKSSIERRYALSAPSCSPFMYQRWAKAKTISPGVIAMM